MTGLTKRQTEALAFIRSYIERKGFSPSYEDIMDGLGAPSKQWVHDMVRRLAEKQVITFLPGRARSIKLIEPEQDHPTATEIAAIVEAVKRYDFAREEAANRIADRICEAVRTWCVGYKRGDLRAMVLEALR
jgi:SOS-response transcriptional repressor LexA